jgi:hypothetical protein
LPEKPAEISPLAIISTNDLPAGAWITLGGSFSSRTCSSSSTTQVTFELSSP